MYLSKQRGFNLIELMVSITLGLILMAGVLSIFFGSKVTYLSNERTARLQENGRVALDFLSHDIRSSGYMGCARAVPFTSTLNTPTSALWNYSIPLQGYESDGAGGYSPALGLALNPAPANDSDVLITRVALRDGRAMRVESDLATLTSPVAVLNAVPAPVAAGTVMMITDCNASSVFQVTGWGAGAPNGLIQHAAAGANPGNATDDLGFLYRQGARVAPLQTYIYYVAIDPVTGEPGLYRQTGATQPAELLIDGVQAIQVAYGSDTDGDRIADQYVAASAITNWDRVMSVAISMLIRSEATNNNVDGNSYALLTAPMGGRTLGPYNDRRSRMVFNTTVALRNRAL